MSGPEYFNVSSQKLFAEYSDALQLMDVEEHNAEKIDMFSHTQMQIDTGSYNSTIPFPLAEQLPQSGMKRKRQNDLKDLHEFSKKLRIQDIEDSSPLPHDLLRTILKFLPAKDYFTAELINRSFRAAILEDDIIVKRIHKGKLHALDGLTRKLQFYGPKIRHLNLKKLFLDTHKFQYGDVETLVRSCNNLETLEISNCQIDNILFLAINALSSLKVLTFKNVVFESTVKLSQLSQTLKNLNTLVLAKFKCVPNNDILREDGLNLLLGDSGLVRLAIKNHNFGIGIKALAPFQNQSVQKLELVGCTLTADLLNNIIKKCDKLETLDLEFIEVRGDFQAEEVKKKESLTNLNYSPSTKVNPVKRALIF